ncbi:hypothetical protein [Actinomyces succiniciruminis]|uniref:Uncharacterized protein n=1 Tax=Actinomyces succiniciruminis TaxID=1522002 RepID=A0A1L7RJX8_9ACTO|nr:hypothetical protein [Actinomyces succiniciruminis]CED91309.1 Hypothetical protein AAM4_1477 [Actinomyces succiniciruminis]
MTNSQLTSSPKLLDRWKEHPVAYLVYCALAVFGALAASRIDGPEPGESGYLTGLEAFVFYVPLLAASLWMVFAEDVSQNSDSKKILRDNVFAPWMLVTLLVLGIWLGIDGMDQLIDTLDGAFLSLVLLYTWLGLIRAVGSRLTERISEGRDAPKRR